MALDMKPLEATTEGDLLALIENRVAEQQNVDYKKALVLAADPPKDELRRDVTSFANSAGGHLVIGMEEDKGFPTDLCGVEIDDPDAFKLRLSDVIQTKVHPRIPGCGIHIVALANGRYAVVIRVPRSFNKPHQITVGKDGFEFWARNAAGKYRLSVDQLRSVILQSESVAERIRQFRMERVATIIAGDTPVPIRADVSKIALHLVPLTAFDAASQCDISRLHEPQFRMLTATMMQDGGSAVGGTYNVDGYVSSLALYMRAPSDSYLQVFRNGIVEATDTNLLGSHTPPLWLPRTEELILNQIDRAIRLQKATGIVAAPVAVLLSLVNVAECVIEGPNIQSMASMASPHAFRRDILLVPDVVINPEEHNLPRSIRPVLDAIWNAGGYPACLNYDDQGKRK